MDEVIEFDTGPYRNRKVVKPDSSPGGLGWYCLPPSKTPDQLRPTPVWEPLVDVAARLGVTPTMLHNRIARGTLASRKEECLRGNKRMVVLLVVAADVVRLRREVSAPSQKGAGIPPATRVINQGARLLGMAPEEYQAHRNAGESWCSYHKVWEPRSSFGDWKVKDVIRPTSSCREAMRIRSRNHYEQQKALKHAAV